MLNIKPSYTFDDVLLIPKFSDIKSRKSVDISVRLSKGLEFSHPFIPANMKTICDEEMANTIANGKGLAILHRFMSQELQFNLATKFKDKLNYIGFSIGVQEHDYKSVDEFAKLGVKILCIDIAHGHSKACLEMIRYISQNYSDIFLIAGNVATGRGARDLWLSGADAVKSGVGAGAICTTRVETGNGVAQLSCIADCAEYLNELKDRMDKPIFLISDGGAKSAGDCVKGLCFADMIMAGNLFAGTTEAPGIVINKDGKKFKAYEGSSTHKQNHIEGVKAIIPLKGSVNDVLTKLSEGLKSGMAYQGCHLLHQLKYDPQFTFISNAGLIESHPHDIKIIS